MTDSPTKLTKEQWLRELESGRHAQWVGTLMPIETMISSGDKNCPVPADTPTCCIGIAPKVLNHIFRPRDTVTPEHPYWMIEGFTEEDKRKAVDWNDIQRLTFPQIAAKFRERWNLPLQPSVSSNSASIADPAPQIDNEP